MSVNPLNLAGSSPSTPTFDLPRGSISASRISWNPSKAAEANDGDAVRPGGKLRETGIKPLDKTAERMQSMVDYAPDVVSQTSSATIRGGIYGAICGSIIGLFNQGPGIIGDLFTKTPPAGLIIVGLFASAAGLLGGILGFLKSGREHAKELKTLLFRGQPPPVKFTADTYEKH